MSASPLSFLGSSSRSLEWLAGPGAFLTSTALSTGQLGSLGPIASLVEGATGAASGDATAPALPDAVAGTANQIVLETHAQLEDAGHQVAPLNGPLHGLTTLGETVGLGHLGEGGHLLTDLGGVAANPTDPGTLAPVLSDAGGVADAANALAGSVTAAPEAGNGLVGSGSVLAPATGILNQAVLNTHATLEDAGHQIPVLNAPIHAVTGLGETVGLGHLGEAGNLLSDVSTLPGSLLNGGGLASASPALADLGHVLGSVDTLVGSLTGAADGGGLLSPTGTLGPVTTLANTAILDLHTTLETIGHEVSPLNDAIHGLTNLGETVGLGHLGEGGNLLTDTAALPGHLLGGEGLSALSPILGDAGPVATATGGLLGGVTGIVGGLGGGGESPLGGLGGVGTLLGQGAPLQPAADAVNSLIDGVHANLEQVGHDVPVLNDPVHSVIGLGNTLGLGELGQTSNLLTDAANLPGAIAGGDAPAAIGQAVSDAGHGLDAAGGVVGSVTGALSHAGSGAPADAVGSLLGTLTGGLGGGDAAGTHPLVDIGAGPTTATPAADVAVLTPGSDAPHAVQVSAVAAPADQPGLLHTALLSGDGIAFPQTGHAADSLVGQLHDITAATTATPAEVGASHDLVADLGLASLDLGGHAAATHTDPTPHSATTGIHLLGL
ncbi:hypothetical protein [Methylobacterium sp. J-076]|uniref:hypothetical protein n=1 Tax=Methylobacterium sp. J-076 TaxID=2836655 RepID=UPI001FBB87BC|nr:hypothetical protein [Methylobacterium sp. J-076]MCJ2012247.1 hypothetical protein [Methylobacterium sp. J-076]